MKSAPWILAGVLAGLFTVGLLHAASDPAPANLPSPAIDIGKCCGPFNCEAYGDGKETRFVAVLELPSVVSPSTAVQVFIASQAKSNMKKAKKAAIVALVVVLYVLSLGPALRLAGVKFGKASPPIAVRVNYAPIFVLSDYVNFPDAYENYVLWWVT